MGTLLIGEDDRNSAKRRRQSAYRKDLELQMREKDAAKLRERYQGMNVDASGWLDPEKRPERLKPLGGSGFMTDRSARDSKVRPYHTLFLYGKGKELGEPEQTPREEPREIWVRRRRKWKSPDNLYSYRGLEPEYVHSPRNIQVGQGPQIRQYRLNLDPPVGLTHHPLTEATAGTYRPNESISQAYNFYATRDLDRPPGYGSIVQPLVVPYVDNRPIIMPGASQPVTECHHNKFNPFDRRDSGLSKDIRALLGITQLERERNKNDDYNRRLRLELEGERRRLMDQDLDARRRMEDWRREMEERRREWERQKLYAERAKKDQITLPKTAPHVPRPSSTILVTDMDETRRKLIEERRKIEELLKAQQRAPDYTQVKILKRPPPPPTPPDSDLANRRLVEEFNYLKHKDKEERKMFRRLYPELPETNYKLEHQQRALLKQQEGELSELDRNPAMSYPPPNADPTSYRRPDWMDESLTPFPHRLRHKDRLYRTNSFDGDLDRIHRRADRRERMGYMDEYDKLKLSSHRPISRETLTDDTWIRPASPNVV